MSIPALAAIKPTTNSMARKFWAAGNTTNAIAITRNAGTTRRRPDRFFIGEAKSAICVRIITRLHSANMAASRPGFSAISCCAWSAMPTSKLPSP